MDRLQSSQRTGAENQISDEDADRAGVGLQFFSQEQEFNALDSMPAEARKYLNDSRVKWSAAAFMDNFHLVRRERFPPRVPDAMVWRWLISAYREKEEEVIRELSV